MTTISLLGISGALRAGSTNTKLVREAARHFGPCNFSLGDIRMPLYDGDLEEADGMPAEAVALRAAIQGADGVVISTPEYNGNIPGVLKNALDWISRGEPAVLAGKPVAIMSAAGRFGGARAQYSLRLCLTAFRPRLVPGPDLMVVGARGEFDDDERLKSERYQATLTDLMAALKREIERS